MRKQHVISPMTQRVAARLKTMREAAKLTTGDVAEQLGFSQSYASRLESGKIKLDIDVLQQLATIYGVSLFQLLDDGSHKGISVRDAFGHKALVAMGDGDFIQLVAKLAKSCVDKSSWLFEACKKLL